MVIVFWCFYTHSLSITNIFYLLDMLYSAYEKLKLEQQEVPQVAETDDLAWLRESNERLRNEMLRVSYTFLMMLSICVLNGKVALIVIGAIRKASATTAAAYQRARIKQSRDGYRIN